MVSKGHKNRINIDTVRKKYATIAIVQNGHNLEANRPTLSSINLDRDQGLRFKVAFRI